MATRRKKDKRDREKEPPEADHGDDLSPEAVRALWARLCATQSERICYHCVNLTWPKRLLRPYLAASPRSSPPSVLRTSSTFFSDR